MKKADADLTLENEKLDQYLDAADPAPPVVVVQYRNRGIPSWVVFPLVALITFGAHRTLPSFRCRTVPRAGRRVETSPGQVAC